MLRTMLGNRKVLLTQEPCSQMALFAILVHLCTLEEEMDQAQGLMAKMGALFRFVRATSYEVVELRAVTRPIRIGEPCNRSSKGCTMVCVLKSLGEVSFSFFKIKRRKRHTTPSACARGQFSALNILAILKGSSAAQSAGNKTHVPLCVSFTPHWTKSVSKWRSKCIFPACVIHAIALCCNGHFLNLLT